MSLHEFYRRHLRETMVGSAARGLIRAGFAARRVVQDDLPRHGHDLAGRARMQIAIVRVWFQRRYLRVWSLWYRAGYVFRYYRVRIAPAFPWLWTSRETSNFTYDLTERNRAHLASLLAVVLRRPADEIAGFIRELVQDTELERRVVDKVKMLGRDGGLDARVGFGRREGWYAIVRALKPRVVVETGVEKGLGATVLCAALLRNRAEGHPGRYYGTDIDPGAGLLWDETYRQAGEILYGDSIHSLQALDETVDLFINDSDHSADYEAREYRVILPKLSPRAVMLADNAHVTDELYKFSQEVGRQFLFFREEPADHWYLGAGIGLSFARTDDAR